MSSIFYTLSLSLLDSLTTTQQIIIFTLLLTTAKPVRNALSYLVGLGGAYFLCGFAGYFALDQLRLFLSQFLPAKGSISNPQYYQSEFLTGVIMAAIGIWFFYRKKKAKQGRMENFVFSKLRTMNSWVAFGLGIFISVTSFPVSAPYLIALARYSALQFSISGVAAYILLYNLGYLSPMILILALYLMAGRGAEDDPGALHEKTNRLNVHITTWTFIGFGIFSMVDAGCFFLIGHALIKDRYF